MLHELLVALHGISGDIFVDSSSSNSSNSLGSDIDSAPNSPVKLKVTTSSPQDTIASSGELAICASLLELGTCYRQLDTFVRQHAGPYRGLHLATYACSLNSILDAYRQRLARIEECLLIKPQRGLSFVQSELSSFTYLLPKLLRLTIKFKEASSPGLMINLLLVHPTSLPDQVHRDVVIGQLLTSQLRLFVRQLAACLVYEQPHQQQSICDHLLSQLDSLPSLIDDRLRCRLVNLLSSINPREGQDDIPSHVRLEFASMFDQLIAYCGNRDKEFCLDLFSCRLTSLLDQLVDRFDQVKRQEWITKHQLPRLVDLARSILLLGRGDFLNIFLGLLVSKALSTTTMTTASTTLTSESTTVLLDGQSMMSSAGLVIGSYTTCQEDEETDRWNRLLFQVNAAFLEAVRLSGLDNDDDQLVESIFRFVLLPSNTATIGDIDSFASLTNLRSPLDLVWKRLAITVVDSSSSNPVIDRFFSRHQSPSHYHLFDRLVALRRTQLLLHQYWLGCSKGWRLAAASQRWSIGQDEDQLRRHQLLVCNRMLCFVNAVQHYFQMDIIESQHPTQAQYLASIDERASNRTVATAPNTSPNKVFIQSLDQCSRAFATSYLPDFDLELALCRRFAELVMVSDGLETQGHHQCGNDLVNYSQSASRQISSSSSDAAAASQLASEFDRRLLAIQAVQEDNDGARGWALWLDPGDFYSTSYTV